jgi:hypothetical protein
MINYLKRQEIDSERWDYCIRQSWNRKVYGLSWYLDIVSPGWSALAEEDYHSVFPLTRARKFLVDYLFQPFFAQQLGLFSADGPDDRDLERFIQAIPREYRYVDIHLSAGYQPVIPGSDLIPRRNYQLVLSGSYEAIFSQYSENTKRNIKKAREAGVNTGRNLRAEDLVRLFRENFGEKEGKLNELHYGRMEELISTGLKKGQGNLAAAWDSDGILSAAAFFLKEGNRVYFLFAASDASARENGAMFLLIDQFIREHAGQEITLDFEGGNEEGIGRFYRSFGSSESAYFRFAWNRFPLLLKRPAGIILAARQGSKH